MANHFVVVFHKPERVIPTPPPLVQGMGLGEVSREQYPGITTFEWRQRAVKHRSLSSGYPLHPDSPVYGEWSLVERRGAEWVARTSLTMSEHLYWTQTSSLVIVSNRALIVAQLLVLLGEQVSLDRAAMTSLLTKSYPCCTERTSIREVSWLGDAELHIDPVNLKAQRIPRDPLSFKPDAGQTPDWEQLAQHLIDNLQLLDSFEGMNTSVALTGGKDSRLVLAALLAGGRQSQIDRYYISARAEHADAQVASMLAAKYQLPFERVEPAQLEHELETLLERHVLTTEGMLNAWDIKFVETDGFRVGVNGLLGEFYRRQRASGEHSGREAAQVHYAQRENLGGIVREDVFVAQQRDVERWFTALHEDGMPWDWSSDLFYLKQRVPRWMGQAKMHDSLGGVHFNPLFHEDILSAYYMLDLQDRGADRVHFELMLRLAPELVSMPFAQSQWDAAMVARSSDPSALISRAPISHQGPIMELGWHVPLLRRSWKALRSELEGALPQWSDVLNVSRCIALLDAAELCLGLKAVSRVRAVQLSAAHPVLVARGYKNPKKLTQAILGLCTLVRFAGLFERIKAKAYPPTLI